MESVQKGKSRIGRLTLKLANKHKVSSVIKILRERGLTVTGETIRNWCNRYGIGLRIGNLWFLSDDEIEDITSGNIFLNRYRSRN